MTPPRRPLEQAADGKNAFICRDPSYVKGMMRSVASLDRELRVQVLPFWLLLLSIFTHAILPAESPLQRVSGSAFSVSTAEVSLAPQRKSRTVEQAPLSAGDDEKLESAGGGSDPPFDAAATGAPVRFDIRRPSPAGVAQPAGATARGAAPFQARAPPSH